MAEKITDRMGRTNFDKSGIEITAETLRQDIVFDGRWATWPRTLDGTRILFSCLTKSEKAIYYAYRKKGNPGSGSSSSAKTVNETQLKKFSDHWTELAPLLTEEQIQPVFAKTWAVFPGLRLPIETLKLVYPELDYTMCEVLGVTALSQDQVKKLSPQD